MVLLEAEEVEEVEEEFVRLTMVMRMANPLAVSKVVPGVEVGVVVVL